MKIIGFPGAFAAQQLKRSEKRFVMNAKFENFVRSKKTFFSRFRFEMEILLAEFINRNVL
jgi:hypothetical protein